MASRQTDTSSSSGTSNDDVAAKLQAALDKALSSSGNQSSTISQPIGVPFYQIDPTTGQPYSDPTGSPVRWGATIQSPGNGFNEMGQLTHESTQTVLPR